MKTALITGGNKGIGLEICKQMVVHGFRVYLVARDPERGKAALKTIQSGPGTITFLLMDVTSKESITSAFQEFILAEPVLDVLINNAGILSGNDNDLMNGDDQLLLETMQTNAVGSLMVATQFSKVMREGSRIINVSSGGGSMDDGPGGWAPFYCVSKSTLNAITRQMDYFLYPKGILVNCMCPGWVRTDMGGAGASRSVEKGAETVVWLATEKNIPHGKFLRDKKVIPW